MNEIILTINGQRVSGQPGNTILEVAQRCGIQIPTLCHDPCLDSIGACRVCLVEDEKRGNLVAACVTPIAKDMLIKTASQMVIENRKVIVKLLMANHPDSCLVCEKGNRCKLRQIAADLGIGRVEYDPMPRFCAPQELNPFLRRDLSKCILCAKCIRADHDLVVEGAIDYADRGFEALPCTQSGKALDSSGCTFCGTCLEICPTGALFENGKRFRGTASKRTVTTCPLCGCGCAYWLEVSNNQVVGVRPGIPGSANGITLCAKGHFGYESIHHPDRLAAPLLKTDEGLIEVAWDEALQTAAEGLQRILSKNGPDSVAVLTGAHCTNEEAFLLKRFCSDVLKTPHAACSAMDMHKTSRVMQRAFGFVGTNSTLQELEEADGILLIGANPTETAPLVGYAIKRAVRKKGARLLVIDPVEIKLARFASVWLQPALSTDETLLFGLLSIILEDPRVQKTLKKRSPQYLKALLKSIPPETLKTLRRQTLVSRESLAEAADMLLSAGKVALVFGNGIIQQPCAENLVKLLCAIGTVSGSAPKAQPAVFPLIKQSNAMGCSHMGLCNVSPESVFNDIRKGRIKGLWVIGDDPLTSLPGTAATEAVLDRLECLIVSDSFLTATGKKAVVVFPSAAFAEKSGTLTSLEGRVQRISAAVDCPAQSRPDVEIIALMSQKLGTSLKVRSEKDITRKIMGQFPLYGKMSRGATESGYFSCLLPRPALRISSRGVPAAASGRQRTRRKFPYKLIAGSVVFQLGCGDRTRFSPRLEQILQAAGVEVNPSDAAREGVREGDLIKLVSSSGEKKLKARLTARVPEGVLFLPRPLIPGSALLPASDENSGRNFFHVKIERAFP